MKHVTMIRAAACAVLLSQTAPLAAEVTHSDEHSFSVRHTLASAAEPYLVYRTMTAHIDQWWDPAHSFGGEAARLYLDTHDENCFCERLPNGGRVEHLHIVYLAPGEEIRFVGGLGPLQQMAVQGRMSWKIVQTDDGSEVTFEYRVFGHPEGGLAGIAPVVDRVIGDQLARLGQRLARK